MSAQDKHDKKKSGHSEGHAHPTSSWVLTGAWANAWKIFAGLGALGLVGAVIGFMGNPERFAFSWMFAFVTCLAIALGAIFFVLIQRLTSAGWSVTVRRTAEFFGYGIIGLIPLFIPILMSMGHLFPWLGHHESGSAEGHGDKHGGLTLIAPAHAQTKAPAAAEPARVDPATGKAAAVPAQGGDGHAAATAEEKAAPMVHVGTWSAAHEGEHGGPGGPDDKPTAAGHGGTAHAGAAGHGGAAHDNASAQSRAMHESHALIHQEVMAKKSPYLNKTFFYIRAVLYFIIWAVLGVRLLGYSTAQDTTKDPELTVRAQRFAAPATFLFALSLTFAAFDWIMSLEPTWFSTIFGVYYFAAGVVSSYAVIILVTMALRTSGPLSGAVTVEHYHDLGKLMFGFLVFWAYIGFSQFMLIWYAALPEETTWYHHRWDNEPWAKVTMAIIIGHFVVPFFWTISRTFKRNLGRLQIGAGILLVMHVVDMYWFVMPNFAIHKPDFTFHWIDMACLLAVGGVYGAVVFHRMTKHSLVPIGDPRLERSLHFQNA